MDKIMMPRIDHHWIILGLAALAMFFVPWYLLSRQPEPPAEKPPLLITKVKPQEIAAVDTLLEKPIFNSERAPLAFADEMLADAGDAPTEEVGAEQAPAPTLVGVVSKRRGKAVAIVKGQDGSAQTIAPGERIDGWRLLSVGKSAALFASASGQVNVSLDFANKAIGGGNSGPPQEPESGESPDE